MAPEVERPDTDRRSGESRPTGAAALFFSSLVARRPAELPSPALPYRLGERLADGEGRYELVSLVARGSQAAVYRGRDRKLAPDDPEPRVAVKLYPSDVDPSGSNQALVEARKTHLAQDISVVTILDASRTDEGWPYLVMPLLRGTDLRTWRVAHQKAINSRVVATIGKDLAHALASVHAANLLHCDVSPQNILIDAAHRPILADFGCAMHAAGSDSAPGGTPAFMAPERFRDARPTAQSDVAELSGVLYWLATGEPPYGLTEADIRKALADPAEADSRRKRMLASASVDPSVAALLRRGLSVTPGERPTAAELRDALGAWLARSVRLRNWLIAAAAVAVAFGVAMSFLPSRGAPTYVSLNSHDELIALADALGADESDPHVLALWSRGRSKDVEAPAVAPEATLQWVNGRSGRVMRAGAVGRWAVATLTASLALERDNLHVADQWLPVAESAYREEDEMRVLADKDPRLLIRLRSLVAAARVKRLQASTPEPVPIAAERLYLMDCLEAGIVQGWPAPQGAPTPTTETLQRILDSVGGLEAGPASAIRATGTSGPHTSDGRQATEPMTR